MRYSRTELIQKLTREELETLSVGQLSVLCNQIGVSQDSWDTAAEARNKIWRLVQRERGWMVR